MLWRCAQHLFHSYGWLRLQCGDTVAALAYADECLHLATATNSTKNIVKARRLRGEVFLALGNVGSAAAELGIALEVARRLQNPPQLYRTLVTVGDLHMRKQQSTAARRAYGNALAVSARVAGGLEDARLRQTFLNSSEIMRIHQFAGSAAPVLPVNDELSHPRPNAGA
jgi:hypothetical protein